MRTMAKAGDEASATAMQMEGTMIFIGVRDSSGVVILNRRSSE